MCSISININKKWRIFKHIFNINVQEIIYSEQHMYVKVKIQIFNFRSKMKVKDQNNVTQFKMVVEFKVVDGKGRKFLGNASAVTAKYQL